MVIYYPSYYELSANETSMKNKEKILFDDLASNIIQSFNNDHFYPYVQNRNDIIRKEAWDKLPPIKTNHKDSVSRS